MERRVFRKQKRLIGDAQGRVKVCVRLGVSHRVQPPVTTDAEAGTTYRV